MIGAAFAREQPRFGGRGDRLPAGPGVVLFATIRRDGTPRLSPVEPLFWRADLWLSMGWDTRKTLDLQRDPRLLVHNVITDREGSTGEYKVRGRAVAEPDPAVHQTYATEVKHPLRSNPQPPPLH